eukprot:1159282-Pelagomonas_calceolata.AAC.7
MGKVDVGCDKSKRGYKKRNLPGATSQAVKCLRKRKHSFHYLNCSFILSYTVVDLLVPDALFRKLLLTLNTKIGQGVLPQ